VFDEDPPFVAVSFENGYDESLATIKGRFWYVQLEEWVADMVALALAYGDDRLYDVLRREPKNVRKQVRSVIEQQMQQDVHFFRANPKFV
jgi:hypothetical protein